MIYTKHASVASQISVFLLQIKTRDHEKNCVMGQ